MAGSLADLFAGRQSRRKQSRKRSDTSALVCRASQAEGLALIADPVRPAAASGAPTCNARIRKAARILLKPATS